MQKKRTLALLLALILLGSSFVSCSDATTDETAPDTQAAANPSAAETEETEFSILSTLPEYTFNGDTVSMLSRVDSWWQYISINAEEISGETINDAIYNRNLAFMEAYDVNLSIIDYDGSATNLIRQAVSAGDSTYDVAVPNLNEGAAMVNEDIILNLYDISTLDLSNPAWDQNASDYYSIAGKLYYGVSDISLGKNEAAWIYMFNKRLLDEYNLEDPYTLVREDRWTFDKTLEFMAAASNDTNGNGEPDEGDRFGLATHDVNYYALLVSAGQPMAGKNYEEDVPFMNASNESFVNVYDKITEYFTDEKQTVMEYEGETFMAGNALLCGQVIACVRLFREMEDDFGIVPTPKFDEAQEQYYTYVIPYDVYACVVPVSVLDPERSGIIMQAMAIYSMEYLTPAYYDITITGKGLRDEDSAEMLDLILSSTVYDLARMYDWGAFASGIPSLIHGKRDFTSNYKRKAKAIEGALQKTIETYNNNTN
ncbi:MAG: hypothetical protein IJF78_02190 [Clostridia bacterium]|nr:hypothetical protein [Clostridia bacterium]